MQKQKQLNPFAQEFVIKMAKYVCLMSNYCGYDETVKEFTAQLLERDYDCLKEFITDEYPEELETFESVIDSL